MPFDGNVAMRIPGRGVQPGFPNWWRTAIPFLVLGLLASLGLVWVGGTHLGALGLLALPVVLFAVVVLIAILWRRLQSIWANTSRLTWWHFLWLLLFASALVFQQRGVNEIKANPLDAWALYRVAIDFIVGLILLACLGLRRPPFLGSMFRGLPGTLTLFGLVCVASSLWSVYPSWTLFKSVEYLLGVALVAAILEVTTSVESFRSLFEWTLVLYGLLLVSVWSGALIWPQPALHPIGLPKSALLGVRLTGVMPAQSSEGVGIYSAMLALVSLCRLFPASGGRRRSGWYLVLLVACLTTMIFSQTRLAIAGFVLGALVAALLSKRLRPRSVLTLSVGAALLLGGLGSVIWAFLKRGENHQSLTTLSSRIVWWTFAWHKFLERPLLGFGAYAAGRFEVMSKLGLSATASLHSDYIEILVGTSIWGLIPFLAAIVGTWWFLLRYFRSASATGPGKQLAYEAVAVFALLTLNSPLVPMFTWQAPLYFLVILGYAEFLRRRLAAQRVSSRYLRRIPYAEAIPHDAAP